MEWNNGNIKILHYGKDGGPESKVWGFWPIAIKRLFSIVLLRFENGSREAFHSHAFDCVSWVLTGKLLEEHLETQRLSGGWARYEFHEPNLIPVITRKKTFHKVTSTGRTWVISFRGPWAKTWQEFLPNEEMRITLTNGRKIIQESKASND